MAVLVVAVTTDRLFGSYEALEGGVTEDALVDFTGGIGCRVDLTRKRKLPSDLFAQLQALNRMCTLMGCSINVTTLRISAVLFVIFVLLVSCWASLKSHLILTYFAVDLN